MDKAGAAPLEQRLLRILWEDHPRLGALLAASQTLAAERAKGAAASFERFHAAQACHLHAEDELLLLLEERTGEAAGVARLRAVHALLRGRMEALTGLFSRGQWEAASALLSELVHLLADHEREEEQVVLGGAGPVSPGGGGPPAPRTASWPRPG